MTAKLLDRSLHALNVNIRVQYTGITKQKVKTFQINILMKAKLALQQNFFTANMIEICAGFNCLKKKSKLNH